MAKRTFTLLHSRADRNGTTHLVLSSDGKRYEVQPDGSIGYYINNIFGNRGVNKFRWINSEKTIAEVTDFIGSLPKP